MFEFVGIRQTRQPQMLAVRDPTRWVFMVNPLGPNEVNYLGGSFFYDLVGKSSFQ